MTLEDIIALLAEETQEQTLTEKTIRRCVLLAYDLGLRDAYAKPDAPLAVPDIVSQPQAAKH